MLFDHYQNCLQFKAELHVILSFTQQCGLILYEIMSASLSEVKG